MNASTLLGKNMREEQTKCSQGIEKIWESIERKQHSCVKSHSMRRSVFAILVKNSPRSLPGPAEILHQGILILAPLAMPMLGTEYVMRRK